MAKSARFAFPCKAFLRGGETNICARPNHLNTWRRRPSCTEINPADTAAKRRTKHLVDHGGAAFAPVLDRENAAVRQSADRQAGAIFDPHQSKRCVARQCPASLAGSHLIASLAAVRA